MGKNKTAPNPLRLRAAFNFFDQVPLRVKRNCTPPEAKKVL